jgi:hypothetical protein
MAAPSQQRSWRPISRPRLSTGPKTEAGKKHSSLNALKHGLLASTVLVAKGSAEESAQFAELLAALDQDLKPVGRLEEMMVEKIAVCWWRHKRALKLDAVLTPADDYSDRVVRYETSNQRQLAHAINQLERLQRARQGEHVPAPVSVQLSSDP